MTLYIPYKQKFSFEERSSESNRILIKYPDRVPIICERLKTSGHDCPFIDKNKYLVPRDLTIGQFLYVIRKRLKITSEKAIFLFINDHIMSSSQIIGDIYENNKDNDGFMYVSYTFENTFG